MTILTPRELMGVTWPQIDLDEEYGRGKFAANAYKDGSHVVAFTFERRPDADFRRLLSIITPSSAATNQAALRCGVTSSGIRLGAEFHAGVRYLVCPVGSLTIDMLEKAVKQVDPTHIMIDPDTLSDGVKQHFKDNPLGKVKLVGKAV